MSHRSGSAAITGQNDTQLPRPLAQRPLTLRESLVGWLSPHSAVLLEGVKVTEIRLPGTCAAAFDGTALGFHQAYLRGSAQTHLIDASSVCQLIDRVKFSARPVRIG